MCAKDIVRQSKVFPAVAEMSLTVCVCAKDIRVLFFVANGANISLREGRSFYNRKWHEQCVCVLFTLGILLLSRWRRSDESSLRIWTGTPNCGRLSLVVRVRVCVCVCWVSRLTFVYSFDGRKADFSDAMKLVLCIPFVSLHTWKCTWVCPVLLVNGVLSHYCTCLKGYLAIVVLGRTGAASVAAHFRTYFRWQEKTTTCLCQRSSIVFISVEEIVITCVCVCKEGPQPFCSEKRSNVYGTDVRACSVLLSYVLWR